MSDDRDDDPSDEPKSSRGSKKRFQERDERDDRPRKKQSRNEDEDEPPRSKRRADDDDSPKPKRRVADDGPRVKSNDNIPVVMLMAFIGSALGLLILCAGCGWWSFDVLVGGGREGSAAIGGGGGNEFEVTSATRQPGFRFNDAPTVTWAVTQKQEASGGAGIYYVIIKCGTAQPITKQLYPGGKGWSVNGSGSEMGLRGTVGKTEVWVEKRPNPVANGKVVSNVYVIP